MSEDPLQFLPVNKWPELQESFKSDFPRSVSAYSVLETQKKWIELGLDYGFKVYCPFGDARNGMVAINRKDVLYQVIIQCPSDDTTNLELALRNTEVLDWSETIELPFCPQHIIRCLQRLVEYIDVEVNVYPGESFMLEKQDTFCKIISLPPEITFDHLSQDHVDLVDSKWPHRYPNSQWYFKLLINAKSGYGLFKNKHLISWVFHNESGNLGHVYTLEEYRRNGYGELLLKIVSNILLQDNKSVVAYAVKGNEIACNMYKKLGFKSFGDVAWCYVKRKNMGLSEENRNTGEILEFV